MNNFSKQSIQSKLRSAALNAVNEERMRLAAEMLEEETPGSTVPGIVKWDARPGIGTRRSYQFRHPETKIQYSIEPSTDKEKDGLYHTSVFHPDDNEHYSIGTYPNPNDAAKAAREHHESICNLKEEVLSFSAFLTEAGHSTLGPHTPPLVRHHKMLGRHFGHERMDPAEKERIAYELRNAYKLAKKEGRRNSLKLISKKIHALGLSLRILGLR
jgi:hypothetical protein